MSTICSVSTPHGLGGIAVIRISGPLAFKIADKVFKSAANPPKTPPQMKTYTCAYGQVYSNDEIIDDCILSVFRAPHSFTGEDVCEISVHGGYLTAKKTVDALINSGAVHARNGEFTERAFLNGKLSLTQAESVMDVIRAKTNTELRMANAKKDGLLAKRIEKITGDLRGLCAKLGVWADYPDDYDYYFENFDIEEILLSVKSDLEELTKSPKSDEIIRNGIPTVVIGKPNVGKSSFLNCLTGRSTAIVSDIPGTTRDIIETEIMIGEHRLRIKDTAGIHETADIIETIGIARAKEAADTAEIKLLIFDAGNIDDCDFEIYKNLAEKSNTIAIINKTDLNIDLPSEMLTRINAKAAFTVKISAKNGTGIDEFTEILDKFIKQSKIYPDTEFVLNERQMTIAAAALSRITETVDVYKTSAALDIISVMCDSVLSELLTLSGENITVAVADKIFSEFCVGK
ncbi:MAG: tRNA uridine-5-carboxymethylaminomethyl(34) synthesis GTPase MnmE [Ruminococcus sp.]|jgi:tRNA modification GTPase|nr:tRNA uridine-5-carboxymethylaminomethyl(34) synthesis GTPase MnmE [Ruminococcus sp.]